VYIVFIFLFAFLGIATFTYMCLCLWSLTTWRPIARQEVAKDALKPVSILIIARNEEDNILACLESIRHNDYPSDLIEVILVDDHSADLTVQKALGAGIPYLRVYSLSSYDLVSYGHSYKKAGQYYGISEARHPYILQIDADCTCDRQWIRSMMTALSSSAMALGPVKIDHVHTILSRWQSYENMGTHLLTVAGYEKEMWYNGFGANMGFEKALYFNYTNHADVSRASGDDLYFIKWASERDVGLKFHLDRRAMVVTLAESSLSALIQQRLRWASKLRHSSFARLTTLMTMVGFYHIILLISFIASLILQGYWMIFFVVCFLIRALVDVVVLTRLGRFFDVRYHILLAIPMTAFHICYIVFIGIVSRFSIDYVWKSRRVR